MDQLQLHYFSPNGPTHWPRDNTKKPDIIDFFVHKGLSKFTFTIDTCLDGSSDHNPVILEMSNSIRVQGKAAPLYNEYTDWDSFHDLVEETLNLKIPLKNPDDVDSATMHFINTIQEACWKCTPLKVSLIRNKSVPWEKK